MLKPIEVANMDPGAPRSQTSAAYVRVRADILSGRLAPGEKLKIAELASSLEVSPGAVREALSRLVPEQLVVSRDQKGFTVAPVSIEDLHDLTELRCEIEALALRRSAKFGKDDWEAAVLASAHRLRRTPNLVDGALAPAWIERHREFHAALVSACESPRLFTLHSQLYEQAERYRGLSVHFHDDRNVQAEHQAIVDAALDRDADLLVDLTVAHIRETTALLLESAQRQTWAAGAA